MKQTAASGAKSEQFPNNGSHGSADFVPCLVLVTCVASVQYGVQSFSLLIMALSLALGLTIVAGIPKGLLRWFTTSLAGVFLTLASYVDTMDQPMKWDAEAVAPAGPVAHAKAVEPAGSLPQSAVVQENTQVEAVPSATPASWTGETLSVVLPCAFEGIYASRTVESVWQHTKKGRLKEIIVVDDGSSPKLVLDLHPPLRVTAASAAPQPAALRGSDVPAVRLLRHEKTMGLIAAKKSGGDAALGDVIVFFDCHVKPRDGWEEAFLKQMHRAGDHRTMVVPTITALNPDTWEETAGASSTACYMMWNADFTWLVQPGRDVPIMSGGLLALSKKWWEETGGYDDHMIAWGGENIDQSLRSWLCGGRIEVAEGAFVAHMWRDPNNPKTRLKYTMPTEDVMRNKARAVSGWLGPFSKKTFSTFPEYEAFFNGENSIGDLSNFEQLKKKLQCADFSAYIQRFSYVFIDGGLVPEKIFQLQEESTGLCLEREVQDSRSHNIVLAPCVNLQGNKGVLETQIWHLANRDHSLEDAPCCSGIMNWNFLQCLSAPGNRASVRTEECDISGHNAGQHFKIAEEGGPLLWRDGQSCLAPASPEEAPRSRFQMELERCAVKLEHQDQGIRLRIEKDAQLLCVTVSGDSESEYSLALRQCAAETDGFAWRQIFSTVKVATGAVQLKVESVNVCLDAGQGNNVLAYVCYDKENPNQMWSISGSHLIWEGGPTNSCLHAVEDALRFRSLPEPDPLSLAACADKPGQRIRRADVKSDGTFLLRDADTGKCLVARRGPELETPLRLAGCDDNHRFRELKDRNQVQHVATGFCFDSGAGPPILYPCHEPKALRKQRFQIVDSPGWVQFMRGWDDNGRKRFFERCLDHQPAPPRRTLLMSCHEAQQAKITWRRVNQQEPLEWQLWRENPNTRSRPLGGDMAPPR